MVKVHSICWVEQVSGGTPGRNDESQTFTISRIIVKSRPEDQTMSDFAEPEPLGSVEKNCWSPGRSCGRSDFKNDGAEMNLGGGHSVLPLVGTTDHSVAKKEFRRSSRWRRMGVPERLVLDKFTSAEIGKW